jgi:nitrate reductase NapAB chaperone NapD
MLPPKTHLDTTAEINHIYIIFIWREQEDEDITDILRTQLNHLQHDELMQWNPRGRFVVVVTDQDSSSVMSDALKIYEIMWMKYKAVKTVVLMPNSSGNYTVLDLYTGFPYQNGKCEKVKQIHFEDTQGDG